jgi:hypothetical protein
LPLLIKNAGNSILARIGTTNLKYQFGLKPLIGDLLKLTMLKQAINRRVAELQRLHSEKGYRRTVTVYSGTVTDSSNEVYQSNFGYYSGHMTKVTSEVVRVHCRWYPSATFFPWDEKDGDLCKLATKALLGWTVDYTTIWEALPWSWLIDWCSGVGNFINAGRNTVGATLGSVTVLRHQRTEYCGAASNVNGTAQVEPWSVLRHTKDRTLSSVFPTATFEFLNNSQMGIVGSLAVRGL